MCPIPIDSTVSELRPPKWLGSGRESIPIPVGINLGAKIDEYIWERGVNPAAYFPADQWPLWRGTPEQLEEGRRGFFDTRDNYHNVPQDVSWTLIDIDNDGVEEPVYHDNRTCFYGGLGSLLIVLTNGYATVDRAKSDLVMAHPPRPHDAPVFRTALPGDLPIQSEGPGAKLTLAEDAMRASRYNVFGFRDKNYVTVWGFEPDAPRDPTRPIRVYLIEKDHKRELCTYRYVP